MNRQPILAVVAAVLALMAVAGSRLSAGPAFPAAPVQALPAARTSAVDQEWYCSVGTAVSGGQANASLVLLNASAAILRGEVTVYPNQGGARTQSFALGPWSQGSITEATVAPGPFVAATVSFDGHGGSVDQEVAGRLGLSATACATEPSPDWYFADGTTVPGASLVVGLFNPFPEEALADLTFADGQGEVAPSDFQGIFVPGRSLVTVDVGQHVVEVPDIATTVTVKVGRLVASELQLDAVRGQLAVSLNTGAPGPAPRWYLPEGVEAPGVAESIHVYDPTSRASRVLVRVGLAQGQAAPFALDLAPRSESALDLSDQPRIPQNDPYTLEVVARGGPVVVQRTVDAGPPSTRSGLATMLASPEAATAWALTAGGTSATQDEWVDLFDPGSRTATVSISAPLQGVDSAVGGLTDLSVPAGGQVSVRIGDHISLPDLSLLVRSSEPVVVERDLYEVGAPGISLALGTPRL